jgi:hypothetical protein
MEIPLKSNLVLAAALAASFPAAAPALGFVSDSAAESAAAPSTAALVEALEKRLDDFYVDPAVTDSYRAALAKALAAGEFEGLAGDALAARFNVILQAAHPDLHLKVYAPGTGMFGKEDEAGQPDLPANALEAAGWVAPGIAYVRPFAFFDRESDVERLQKFMDGHAEAKALIIDLRHHVGGELREMDVILADLFAAPTDLLTMTTRPVAWERFEKKAPTERLSVIARDATMVRELHRAVPRAGGARMAKIPVYVLTSRRTASAAEHLALAMKVSGRATVVGDTTRGAGHYGDEIELTGGYSMFIPYGDTVDPKTGKGWEASGVTPDIAIPAKDALDYVLEKLGAPKASSPYPVV